MRLKLQLLGTFYLVRLIIEYEVTYLINLVDVFFVIFILNFLNFIFS